MSDVLWSYQLYYSFEAWPSQKKEMGNKCKISIPKPSSSSVTKLYATQVCIMTDSDVILLWLYWFQFAASLPCHGFLVVYVAIQYSCGHFAVLYDTLSSSDCACVCISRCVLCAAQMQCPNVKVHSYRTRYVCTANVCTANALCMNIVVSLKAYFSSLHISLFYWSVIVLSFHFVQNP